MELANRAEAEKQIADALRELATAHREQLLRYLGTPPDINRVPGEFWVEIEMENRKQLAALLLLLFLGGGQQLVAQVGADKLPLTLAGLDQQAEQWAQQRAAESAASIASTTRQRVQGAVEGYWQDLEPQAMRERIDSAFGPDRTQAIASNETTAATSAGGRAVQQGAGAEGFTLVAYWNSSKDSEVCPICRPLHGKPESVWSGTYPDGPPGHYGCRCWLDYVIGTDSQATPVEESLGDLGKSLAQLLLEGWVTLKPNGDDEEGYARVYLEDGKITKGPAGLAAKGIKGVEDFGKGKGRKEPEPKAEKKMPNEEPKAEKAKEPKAEPPSPPPAAPAESRAEQPAEPKKAFDPAKTSKAKLEVPPGVNKPHLDRNANKVAKSLGITVDDLPNLVGAPDNATVTVTGVGDDYLHVTVEGEGFSAQRTFERDEQGRPVIHNDFLEVDDSGKGLGTKILAKQVHWATQHGFHAIETNAARSDGMNGYTTWPKLGYDGEIPRAASHSLTYGDKDPATGRWKEIWSPKEGVPPIPNGAKRVSDLMKTAEGRDWWQKYGVNTDMTFDLSPGSYSQNHLADYVANRKAKGTLTEADQNRRNDPGLSPDEEKILDQIWDEIGRNNTQGPYSQLVLSEFMKRTQTKEPTDG